VLGWGAWGCGSGLAASEPASSSGPRGSETPGELVRVVDTGDRPLLRLIRRGGDPRGAVALALFPTGGSRAALGLTALIEGRLRSGGFSELEVEAHSLGVVVGTFVNSPDEAALFMRTARSALLEEVHDGDPALARSVALLGAAKPRASGGSAIDSCLGQLGAEGRAALEPDFTASSLENLRKRTVNSSRVGFAALGPPALLSAVERAHEQAWPEGPVIEDPIDSAHVVAVGYAPGGRELRLAMRVADADRALAAARSLSLPGHPLGVRLAALGGRLVPGPVQVTLRPGGACLGLALTQPPGAEAPSLAELASATLVARSELSETLESSTPDDEAPRALLAPQSALEAAALAAWTSVRHAPTSVQVQALVELRAPATDKTAPSRASFDKALQATEKSWREHALPWSGASEPGQSEAWLLVGSRCGTAPEALEEAGFRALALRTMAADFKGFDDVTLEPWLMPDAVGLLGHAPRRSHETPEQHGARLGRAIGRALAGEELDGRDVATLRATQLDQLGENPARALALSVLSAGQPSILEPWGAPLSVAAASSADLERVRAALVEEPLSVAFLDNGGPLQSASARAALSAWLAPHRQRQVECPMPQPKSIAPGTWTLGSASPELVPGRFVGVPLAGRRELGQATAWLLNRPGGYLDQTLTAPGLVATAEARYFGGPRAGALLVALAAEIDQLGPAEQQARALLDRLAKSGFSDADVALARAEQATRLRRELESPRARVVELWYGRAPYILTAQDLRSFVRALSAEKHDVVRLEKYKGG